jgi:DNA-binding NarL/FixJ family response regulator
MSIIEERRNSARTDVAYVSASRSIMRCRHWTPREEERLRELSGTISVFQIAAELRRSVLAVEVRLKSLERTKTLSTTKHWTAEEDATVLTLMDQGKKAPEIARKLRRTPQAIYARLQRLYRRRAEDLSRAE